MRRRWTPARLLRGGMLGAPLMLLACLVSVSGCGMRAAASATPQPLATPIATPGVPVASLLTWTFATLPTVPGSPLTDGALSEGVTLGLAQSDSATVYACAPASVAAVATWVTHDRGASWQATASIAVAPSSQIEVTGCQIVVDATEPTVAVAQISVLPAGGCVPVVDCMNTTLSLTTDAGRQWARFQGPQDTLVEFATFQGATYAIFRSTARSASVSASAFVVSHDDMRTWTPVPGFGGGLETQISSFWLNPYNGRLLALLSGAAYNQVIFMASTDAGAHWTHLASPPIPFAFYDFAVQQPFTDQPWRICGGDPSSMFLKGVQQNQNMDTLACTTDSGDHWVTYHLDVPNDRAGTAASGVNYTLVGIADDGCALLTTPAQLERLACGSGAAQPLGPAPNVGLMVYVAGGGAGALWSAPQGGYSDAEPQGRIFTASYV